MNGAYALAAEISVDKLSMPLLARKLDVGVMSMYNYFGSKDEILEAMRKRALEQYEIAMPFTGEGEWHESLREHFIVMRDLFRENPVLCDLLAVGTSIAPNFYHVVGERIEAIVATLVDAGFTADDALKTYQSLALHSRGFAVLERIAHLDAESPLPERSTVAIDADAMPILAGLVEGGRSLDLVQDGLFELGLDALIDRARRRLAATADH
ncbi:TetR/AcrR family transcriptional regulator [Nocardia miyunensis]|uniref:TetR/AcrR family transcriptional regulator n=1 Tax=Nocardia miyunensis TaxID=282684 RepID=UPI000AD5F34B|nr:TetR/AcrR family transcriptional regulator [Nocardia miyunensis]